MLEDGDFREEKSKGVGIRECSCRIKYVIDLQVIYFLIEFIIWTKCWQTMHTFRVKQWLKKLIYILTLIITHFYLEQVCGNIAEIHWQLQKETSWKFTSLQGTKRFNNKIKIKNRLWSDNYSQGHKFNLFELQVSSIWVS